MVTEPQTSATQHPPTVPAEPFGVLKPHFGALDAFLRKELASFEPEIHELVSYCLDASGKRIRPTLTFFSGWRGENVVAEDLVRLAAVIEMVHLATLVHDDIMDGAEMRRRQKTASRKYGSDSAVLLGDALFAQALNIAAHFPTTEVCRYVSVSARRVCSGEIMQTLAPEGTLCTVPHYRRIIELKTAELFFVSCFLSARLSKREDDYAESVGRFGRHLGIAYQIYDDLADFYGDESKIGKTLGTDLAGGRFTLPVLLLLERVSDPDDLRGEIIEGNSGNMKERIAQMSRLGVFVDVLGSIRKETATAVRSIQPWLETPQGRFLERLARMVEIRSEALKPR